MGAHDVEQRDDRLHVALHHLQSISVSPERCDPPLGDREIEQHHALAVGQELLGQARADEARAAGNQCRHSLLPVVPGTGAIARQPAESFARGRSRTMPKTEA